MSLIAEVANAYLTLAADNELERLAQQTLKSQEDSYALEQKRHEAGTVSALDLVQSQTTVEQARTDAARFEGNVRPPAVRRVQMVLAPSQLLLSRACMRKGCR